LKYPWLLRTFLAANSALVRWFLWALGRWMAFLMANATFTSERTNDLGVGAISLVVADLTAVVALAGQFPWFRAVAGHMAFPTAMRFVSLES
jgi:hypothetical protein